MTGMNGKVAIVTGGGSGLGEAIGKALAKRGVKVVLSDINVKGAERVAGEIGQACGTASAVQQYTAWPEDSEKVVRVRGRHLRRSALRRQQRRHRRCRGTGRRDRPGGMAARNINLNGVLSDEASFMTGGYYLVDGGYTAV